VVPDFDVPVRYLRENFERDDRLAIVLIRRDPARVEQKLATAEEIASPKYQAHLRAANAHGSDVFISMNTIRPEAAGRTKADVDVIRHLYLDVDAGGREAVDRILEDPRMPNPHHILETSPGRHQIIWQVEDFGKAEAENVLRNLAAAHGADPAATDCSRVLRLPGFRNCKYAQPHYVKDVHSTPAQQVYRPADFPVYETVREDAIREASPHVTTNGGKSQSERDYAYALRHLERGDDPAIIERSIANYRRDDKRKPDDYARRTVMKARMKLAGRETVAMAAGESPEQTGMER
jgi:hypothetical protein